MKRNDTQRSRRLSRASKLLILAMLMLATSACGGDTQSTRNQAQALIATSTPAATPTPAVALTATPDFAPEPLAVVATPEPVIVEVMVTRVVTEPHLIAVAVGVPVTQTQYLLMPNAEPYPHPHDRRGCVQRAGLWECAP